MIINKTIYKFSAYLSLYIVYCILFTVKLIACECEKHVKKQRTSESLQLEADSSKPKAYKAYSDKLKANKDPQVLYPEEYKNIKFIGAEKCKFCHSVEYRKWQKTRHAKAYEEIVNEWNSRWVKGFDSSTHIPIHSSTVLSDCEPCHTTGYGYRYGFIDKQVSSNLIGVQCEVCHGAGGEHSKNPKQVKMSYGKKPILEKLCRSCHKQDVSKGFEVGKYIEEIRCNR